MPITESPLRYPGGKSKLYNLIRPIVTHNVHGASRTYVEPFAGGAGLALQLLFNGDVDHLVLNDIDYNIFCFWDTCLHNAEELCFLIDNCNINMDTWSLQRTIYDNPAEHSRLEVAFSTFFLNRCNVSGIIRGGPIGGHNQTGNYGLDARFNREDLQRKIRHIFRERDRIEFFNMDAHSLILNILPRYNINCTILNIDPPYVKKGPLLYENSFTVDDHAKLAHAIENLNYKWIVTYDECDTIYSLYSCFRKEIITLDYSIGNTKSGRELIIYSDSIDLTIPQAQ